VRRAVFGAAECIYARGRPRWVRRVVFGAAECVHARGRPRWAADRSAVRGAS